MIDYVEIRSATLELIGLLDTAKSIIWETQYFGAGAFEVYAAATPQAVGLLQCGNFVTRVDNDGIGIIEAVQIVVSAQDGRMITASGRLAKSILDRRLITYVNGDASAATIFSGNVEERARGLVQDNAVACYRDKARKIPYTERNISIIQLGALAGLTATTESRQVNCDNLLTYTDEFLQQYGYGAKMVLSGGKLAYTVYSGKDRSIGNAEGNNPVIFAEDFDNLIGSNYSFDETAKKTTAIVGGAGEGAERAFTECNAAVSGLARREAFIDTSLAKEVYEDAFVGDGAEVSVKDDEGNFIGTGIRGTQTFKLSHAATELVSATVDGTETKCTLNAGAGTITFATAPLANTEIIVQYTDMNEYRQQLQSEGEQQLAQMVATENFAGSIDLLNSSFEYGTDFEIGDIVTVQDNGLGKYINVRIVAVPEVQDDDGYTINIEFEAVNENE